MAKSKGIDAIVNDQLVGTVLGMGMLVVGVLCGFVAFLLTQGRAPDADVIAIVAVSVVLGTKQKLT